MVFADSLTKAGRLMELQLIFAIRPYRAHSTRELAWRLGIAIRTVRNYLTELSVSGRLPIIQEKKRWRLAPDAKIETPPVRFMLEEAAAVYLEAAQARLEARAGDAMPTCGQATCDCCHRRRERRVVVAISRFKAGGGQSRWARDYCHWRGEKPPARRAGPTFKARRDLFHIGRCEHRPLRKTR